tara:strand:+ start:1342 stop:1518 length:177 start_codon:yes stop_codon:yes gene_type:complete
MSKKEEEEIVLEQKPIVNGNMLEVLDKVLNFNSDYLAFLENELAVKKQQLLKEMEDNG